MPARDSSSTVAGRRRSSSAAATPAAATGAGRSRVNRVRRTLSDLGNRQAYFSLGSGTHAGAFTRSGTRDSDGRGRAAGPASDYSMKSVRSSPTYTGSAKKCFVCEGKRDRGCTVHNKNCPGGGCRECQAHDARRQKKGNVVVADVPVADPTAEGGWRWGNMTMRAQGLPREKRKCMGCHATRVTRRAPSSGASSVASHRYRDLRRRRFGSTKPTGSGAGSATAAGGRQTHSNSSSSSVVIVGGGGGPRAAGPASNSSARSRAIAAEHARLDAGPSPPSSGARGGYYRDARPASSSSVVIVRGEPRTPTTSERRFFGS